MLNLLTDYWFWGSLGFIIGSAVSVWKMVKNGCPFPVAVIAVTVGIYFGMLGTRILWILITYPELFYRNLPLALAFWQQTGTWLAAAPFGGLGIALVLKLSRKPVWTNLGSAAVGLPLAHAIARIGCLCAGCCHGKPTTMPWAIYSNELNAMVHPTQIYSMAGEIITLIILWLLWKKAEYRKYLFPLYALFLSIHRFITGFYRGDYPGPELFPGLRIYQSICIFLFVISLAVILLLKWKKRALSVAVVLIIATTAAAVILKPESEQQLARLRTDSNLYLVITRSTFTADLESWQRQRTEDGFNVVTKSFEEAPSTSKIKSWIKETIGENGGLCSYILVVGDCASSAQDPQPWHIPSIQQQFQLSHTEKVLFFTDCLYGDIDGDNSPDIPVGRIPVRTGSQLKTYINKILEFERRPPRPDFYRAVIWQGAEGYTSSMHQITLFLSDILPEWLDTYIISGQTDTVYSGYPPDQPLLFLEQFKRPAVLSLIASHGSFRSVTPTVYKDEKIFLSVEDLNSAVSVQPSGLLFMLGCDSGRFYTPDDEGLSIAEAFIHNPGGPVAVFASTEAANPLTNYFISREMVEHLQNRPQTMGDFVLSIQRGLYRKGKLSLLQLARADTPAGLLIETVPPNEEYMLHIPELVRNEIIRYTLLGDPSIQLKLPKQLSFDIETIDGDTITFTAQTPSECIEFYVQTITARKSSALFQNDTQKEQRQSVFEQINARPVTILKQTPNSKTWRFTISADFRRTDDTYLRFIALTPDSTFIGIHK